jgi:hypothetical protein
LRAIVDDVWELTGVFDRAAAWAPLKAFARWVAMLPASENNHHSHDFGLLHHSLKVAFLFLDRLRRPLNFSRVEDLPEKDRRPWILAGMAAALLHDCGKLFDMEVRALPSAKVWDPMKEALAAFVRRNVTQESFDFKINFVVGRGLKGHEAKGRALIPVILPPSFACDLTRKTLAVYDACVSHHELIQPWAHWPAAWFAAIILTADREDSAANLKLQERFPNPPPSTQGR